MSDLRIYSLSNFPMYCTTVLTILVTLCITSLVLVYLATRSLCLLTTLLQFPLPQDVHILISEKAPIKFRQMEWSEN